MRIPCIPFVHAILLATADQFHECEEKPPTGRELLAAASTGFLLFAAYATLRQLLETKGLVLPRSAIVNTILVAAADRFLGRKGRATTALELVAEAGTDSKYTAQSILRRCWEAKGIAGETTPLHHALEVAANTLHGRLTRTPSAAELVDDASLG